MKDIRQSAEYAKYMSLTGWQVENIEGVYCFIKKIPILGFFIKIQRPLKITSKIIKILEQKYHPFQIIIESILPNTDNLISKLGFRQNESPYLPTKTLQLDLAKSEKELFQGLKKDCRYALRKTYKLKLITYNSTQISEFRNVWKHSVPFNRYVPSLKNLQALKKSFGKNALYLIEERKNGGAIFLIGNKTAYYWQAFTNKEGRKSQVQYQIVWQGISWAKKAGAKIFDFEGIYDKRFPNKNWLGFTHFKKSFGGKVVKYPGCFKKNY